jgi:hypothetical protein
LVSKTPFRVLLPLAICAWAFLTMGCKRPLGPSFDFAGRQTEIRFPANPPAEVHIRVTDHLKSIGNVPLRTLEVRLPGAGSFGAQNVKSAVNGAETSMEQASAVDRRLMRLAFNPPWALPETRELITEWDLTSGQTARGTIGFSSAGFYIADDTALPLWQPPGQFFSTGGPTPDKETLTISIPSDFRLLAAGRQKKKRVASNVATYQFRIVPSKDFLPYVVAGKYQEQEIRTPQGSVVSWTFQPLDKSVVQTAATRLSASMRALSEFFEPAKKTKLTVHLVEAPGDLQGEFASPGDPGGTSFPAGVLLDSVALAQGLSSETVLQLAEYELARTWFGWRVRPMRQAQILMGRGVGLFGVVVAAEDRGQNQRNPMVVSLLERYDAARRVAADKTLIEPPDGYTHAERVTAGYKAALFFVMLEDLCGHSTLGAAFQSVVASRAGDEAGFEELRAAVETVSRRDLAETFRIWLNRSGIPNDFRSRYEQSANPRAAN